MAQISPSTEFSVRLSVLDLKRCSKEDELTSLLTILCTFSLIILLFWSLNSSRSISAAISLTLEISPLVAIQLERPKKLAIHQKNYFLIENN